MSLKKPQNILLNSKIAVAIVLVILSVLGIALIAQGFVDTHNYRDEVIRAIEEQTHRKVTIKGAVTVSLLPVPTLYIPGMELRDPNSDQPTPAASVDLISIRVGLFSAFTDHPKIFEITLDHPILELVRAEDKLVHWDWLNPALFKALVANQDSDNKLSMQVRSGRIIYHDSNTEKSIVLENINSQFVSSNEFSGNGSFTCYGHVINFAANRGAVDAATNTAPLQLKLTSGASDSVEMKGKFNLASDLPEIDGQLALNLVDAAIWFKPKQQEEEKLFDLITKQVIANKNAKISVPLKIDSDWSQKGLSINMTNLHVEGLNSNAIGKLDLTWREWQPKVNIDLAFSTLDFNEWKKNLSLVFTGNGGDFYTKVYHSGDEIPENPLTQNVDVEVNLVADKVVVGNQAWNHAKLAATLADSAITVNQFAIELPGESSLSLFGVVTPSASNDLRFEGSMETKGESLRNLLTIFDESASGLPETGLGHFSARSNIFISSEQLRLSDADVKLTELQLNGGLVAYFDNTVRLEADVKLKNINFDYFRNIWREKQQKVHEEDFFLKFSHGVDFDWLKKLQATIDLRVGVDHFTFLDRSGDSASFRLYARNGDLGIYDINFVYPDDLMKGSFKLFVNGDQPQIDLALSVGQLDTSYFNVTPYTHEMPKNSYPQSQLLHELARQNVIRVSDNVISDDGKKLAFDIIPQAETVDEVTPPKQATGFDDLLRNGRPVPIPESAANRWPQDLIDMSWMNGISGSLNLNLGRLVYKNLKFDNFKMQTKFSNNVMAFNPVTFSYWGGDCNITGSLYGGKVPALTMNLSMANMHLGEILKDLVDRDNVSGNVSVNASVNTSGVNILSWVSQLEGKMVLVGRGVTVTGINLPAVVDAVAISRTASDVVNSVNSRLIDGSTTFSVDGNINIKNGILRTPGITLKTGAIVGGMIGELKLLTGTMDFTTLFQFPELSSETIPTMSVQLSGPFKSGEMRTDTASLEAFVAKRIISK